jgi:acyl carrier protein
MTPSEITTKVNEVLIEEFELQPEQIRDDAHLFDELGLDSLDAVDLVVALEQRFGGRVPEEEIKNVRTVADLYRLIETQVVTARSQ